MAKDEAKTGKVDYEAEVKKVIDEKPDLVPQKEIPEEDESAAAAPAEDTSSVTSKKS